MTHCGKEAWNVNHEPMDKNRIEGAAKQGERAVNREALVIKMKWLAWGPLFSAPAFFGYKSSSSCSPMNGAGPGRSVTVRLNFGAGEG